MSRDLESLVRIVREEVRAEGPDGGGFTDLFIEDAINEAISGIAEFFPIKDTVELESEEHKNEYELETDFEIENIYYVFYGNSRLTPIDINQYHQIRTKDEGKVSYWTYWGGKLFLTGEIEAEKPIILWITRAPKKLKDKGDTPEVPYYCDKAIKQYAVSACFRESRDYERANFHYGIYRNELQSIVGRAVPQEGRGTSPMIDDSYFPPVNAGHTVRRTDENPGGRVY